MVVVVLLDLAAELKYVVASYPGHVVAQHLVLAIPNALAHALVVDVVRNQRGGGFRIGSGSGGGNFQCAPQTAKLRSRPGRSPLPPVPEITRAEVVCDVRLQGAGESEHEQFAELRPRRGRVVLALLATQNAADVNLIAGDIEQLEGSKRSEEP